MHRPKVLLHSAPPGRPVFSSHPHPRIEFYREEFVKLQECLQLQREVFSEHAISEAECALVRVLASLDDLCGQQDADALVSALLQKFRVLARLAAWNDPRPVH